MARVWLFKVTVQTVKWPGTLAVSISRSKWAKETWLVKNIVEKHMPPSRYRFWNSLVVSNAVDLVTDFELACILRLCLATHHSVNILHYQGVIFGILFWLYLADLNVCYTAYLTLKHYINNSIHDCSNINVWSVADAKMQTKCCSSS